MESEPHRLLGLFLPMTLMLLFCFSSSRALKFNVGGKNGWVVKPSDEGYNHWAERNRFQVNDTLYFKYKKGSDSVLVVNKTDYDSCTTKNPMKKMNDGDSYFTLDKSGPFFFIGGNSENCKKGQKLIVVVMAVRHKTPSPPPTAAPTRPPAGGSPPTVSPGPSEGPNAGDNSPAPSPSLPSGSTRVSGSGVGMMLLLGFFVGLV